MLNGNIFIHWTKPLLNDSVIFRGFSSRLYNKQIMFWFLWHNFYSLDLKVSWQMLQKIGCESCLQRAQNLLMESCFCGLIQSKSCGSRVVESCLLHYFKPRSYHIDQQIQEAGLRLFNFSDLCLKAAFLSHSWDWEHLYVGLTQLWNSLELL